MLMFVLGIIALTSVVVIALLGLALTSARVAGQQAELAREARAADGALEAAVADIARGGGEPCAAVGAAGQVVFTGPSAGTLDVEVTCDSSGTPGAPEADLGGPRVEVVGDTPYGSGPTGGKVPVPSVAGVADPTLASTGTEPLAFNSDVVVNAGAAPLRSGGAPGVTVKGQYRQGDTVGGGCGALGVVGPSQVQDHNDAPVCGAPAGDLAVAEDPSPSVASVPPRSIACPAPDGVVALAPGGYTQAQVDRPQRRARRWL